LPNQRFSGDEDRAMQMLLKDCPKPIRWSGIINGLQERGFPPRSEHSVRNRALRLRVNATAVARLAAKNLCRICLQVQRGHICTGVPPAVPSNVAPVSKTPGS
jgi:hypothetical protein